MQLKTILRQVPDPRGKQGQDYMLWSILSLIVVSLLCPRTDCHELLPRSSSGYVNDGWPPFRILRLEPGPQ